MSDEIVGGPVARDVGRHRDWTVHASQEELVNYCLHAEIHQRQQDAELDRLRAENEAHKRSRQMDANDATAREHILRTALVEARRWIGDGDLADGLHRDYWTPHYAAAVALVDAALGPNA